MKKISILLVAAVTLLAMSCKKSSSSTNNNNSGGAGSMSAKVAGSVWSPNLAVVGNRSVSGGTTVVTIGGTGSQGQINLTLGSYTGAGTYTFGFSNPSSLAIFSTTTTNPQIWSANAGLGSGSIVVTSDAGGYVKGTFSFNGVNTNDGTTKAITEGTFDVKVD